MRSGISFKYLAIIVAACLPMGVHASAAAYYESYTVNLPAYPVSYIAFYEAYQDGSSSLTNSFSAPVGSTTITNPFIENQLISSAFLLGVTTDLPEDAAGQQHLVLFTNDDFALRGQSIAFGTLFPNTDEDTLIADLVSLGSGTGTPDQYNDIFSFANGDAEQGPNGPIGFGMDDSFTAVAFSDGQIIGTGNSFSTPVAAAAVPEPTTWAMMLVGFAAGGCVLRRRQSVNVRVGYA